MTSDIATAGPAADPLADLPPSPAVWCSGLRKRYGRQTAVEDVSFSVARGEVLGLLGPNGAGKTSVIKMLLGLVRPDAGEVLLLGRRSSDPRSRSAVGYLPELFRYQPWLTAAEVLHLHVRLAGADVPAEERHGCLELVGLAARAGDRVGGFSKGMQQRLGLAVALVGRPELVVLDEPTSALDPLGRADVRDVVLSLRERGVAVLLNSHLIGEVERVCDRVVVLDRGRVAASGTLAELLGQREVRLHLTDLSPAASARLAVTGGVERSGDWFTVALAAEDDGTAVPDLVGDLVALGAGVLAAGGGVRRQRADQRRGPPDGVHRAQPGDVRVQPDRGAGYRVPGRAHAVGRDGVGHRAGRARPAGASLGLPPRQVAGTGGLRRRLRRRRGACPDPRGARDGGLLATQPGGGPGAAGGADRRAAHPRRAAVDRHLTDGVGRGRGRPVLHDLGRRRGGRRGGVPWQ